MWWLAKGLLFLGRGPFWLQSIRHSTLIGCNGSRKAGRQEPKKERSCSCSCWVKHMSTRNRNVERSLGKLEIAILSHGWEWSENREQFHDHCDQNTRLYPSRPRCCPCLVVWPRFRSPPSLATGSLTSLERGRATGVSFIASRGLL